MRHILSEFINEILFFILYVRMKGRKRKETSNHGVLLIRFSHIGDFVLWLDAAKAFREIYPKEKITLLCDRYKNVQAIAEKTGYFDEVMVMETRGLGRLASIWQIGKQHYRIVIHADMSRTVLADLFVMAVGAKKRIAPKTDCTRMKKRRVPRSDRVYDKIINCGGIQTMELIRNARFIRALSGSSDFRADLPRMPVLQETLTGMPEYYFVLCPGGEMPQKFWNAEKYAQVIQEVFVQDPSILCVALGTADESEEFQKIAEMVTERQRMLSLMGRTTLTEYVELIRNAAWLLSNDTSAAHIAAAVGTQAVTIAASWDRGRFYPYKVECRPWHSRIPVGIHADVPCAGCRADGRPLQHLDCIEHGRIRCINQIQTVQVIPVIKKVMAGAEEDE